MNKKYIVNIYPLSPMQQGILFHTLYAPSGVYVMQTCYTFSQATNLSAFQQAWQQVIDRHPVLRTSFYFRQYKEPFQVVYKQVNLPWQHYDWRGLSEAEQQERLEAFLQADRHQGFDLSTAPLMRCTFIQLANDTYHFIWSAHHLILDGWSTALVLQEVLATYKALCGGEDLPSARSRPYGDYIAWLQQQDLSQAQAFWQKVLKGFHAPTPLRIDRYVASTSNGAANYDERSLKLSPTTTAALQSLARQHKLTLNTLVQGAYALLLSRYSGEEDVVFGATSAGRPATLAGVESMVGLFINTLPVRVQVSPQESLIPWLEKIQQRQVEAQQYEYSPLVQVHGWSDVPRDLPLFESILVFENYPIDSSLQEWATEMEIREIRSVETTNYPIAVKAGGNSQLALHILYDRDRIDTTTANRLLGHLKTLLEGMVANPHQSLSSLNLLTASERHQLLVEWNDTQTSYPQDKCIHHLVAAQAEQTPDAVAVVFEDQQLTYRQLNVRTNQLARYLQSLGVGPEVLVGVCMTRSLEMVVGLLGVLKAGGAYIPLDPAYPDERLAFMLDDSQASVLLTQQHLVEQLGDRRIQTICLDRDWQTISQENAENPCSLNNPNNLAYVIYTSGSTGKPKGVAIEHHSTVALIDWAKTVFSPAELTAVLASTSICFDLSIFELFVPLSCGGTVILAENALSLPTLAAEKVTLINTVPSAIAALHREQAIPTSVCTINLAGEPLPNDLVQQLYQLEHIQQIFNLYGPSEDTTYSTYALIARDSQAPLPIGRPISNTQVYVLDKSLKPVPIGVAGELYLGGAGLARGYLHRPELTDEKFIPNPFEESKFSRLYKTGDLVRYLPNGNLEFLGRIDSQVKIRGFRIELGEIETVLRQHPTVRDAVALAWEDEPNSQRLVAYIVPQPQQAPNVMELQQFLQQKLPKYMVPNAFVVLEALPLTLNGKVNRKALPAPGIANLEQETFSPPRNPLEQQLVSIWSEILRIEQVGINDNFFQLGGHSLLIVRLFASIREAFQVDLPLQTLFEAPTVATLAERLEIARQASSAATVNRVIALKVEAVLDSAIRPQGIPFEHTTAPACILLTGVTGFVGAFLLNRLLQETQADIYCLVRCSNPQGGKQKIQTSLESYLLWNESQSSRIIPVVGDLSEPLLGLSQEQWRSLVERVDVIYHNGAWVHHASPYSTLKAANVLGTQEVLRLASQGKVKPVHFISTISVFSSPGDAGKAIAENSSLDDDRVPEGGYTQSKWVAEKLIAIARDRGLPVSIYRLGRVSGHSKTGVFNPSDFLYRLLIGCIQLGSVPDGEFLEGLVPVDYVSKAIVHLSKQQESLGKAFHLVNPQRLDLKVLFNVIRSFGYPLQQLSYERWRSELVKIAQSSPEHTLYPLVPFFPPREGADSKPQLVPLQFDCQNTLNGLADSSIFCPPTDEKLLRTYLSYLVCTNILKAPQQPGITVS